MSDFSGISMPFNVGELLKAAMDLIMMVGPLILIGIALYFSEEIFYFIRNAINTEKDRRDYNSTYYKTGKGEKWEFSSGIKSSWAGAKHISSSRRRY